jgi:hypothetical protein
MLQFWSQLRNLSGDFTAPIFPSDREHVIYVGHRSRNSTSSTATIEI